MQTAGSIDQNRVAPFGFARLNRVEHERRRIGALPRADDVDIGALRPYLELFDRRGAERVSRADERLLARRLQQVGELSDGRRFPGPVDANDHRDVRMVAIRRGPLDAVEYTPDLLLDEVAQALAMPCTRADGVDDAFGRGKPDVGRDQQLLERLDRVDVDRATALLFGVGLLDDLFETADNLLFRACQAAAKLVKETQFNPQSPGFSLLRAQHQIVQRRARIFPAGEKRRYLSRDWQFHPVARTQRQRGVRRPHTFCNGLHARENIWQRASARELETDVA